MRAVQSHLRWLGAPLVLCVLGACASAQVASLEQRNSRLRKDIESLNRTVKQMNKALSRHKRNVGTPPNEEQFPPDWDPYGPLPEQGSKRPDVILLSIDTLRADHLGAWGYDRDTSPFLDELAKSGARFEDMWSPSPWTLPSHTTMLSGLLPPQHGAIEDDVRIGDDIALVQEAFQAEGYTTTGVVATLFVSARFGFDRGFDHFHDFAIEGAKMNNASTVDAEHVFAWADHYAQMVASDQPQFIFLHVYDAHYGYNAPPPFNEQFDRPSQVGDALYKDYHHYKKHPLSAEQKAHQIAQYDEEIAYVDHAFRTFVEKWRKQRPNTVVAVSADHGEEFGERGSWGHAHTLFPEQLHVPWVINGPGIRTQVIPTRAGTEDIAPTLAGLARVPFAEGDGTDRTRQLESGARNGDAVSAQFAETSRFQTLRYRWHEPPYDLIVDMAHNKRGLCDLKADPECTETLMADERDRADRMFGHMMDYLGSPWQVSVKGELQVKDGYAFTDGRRGKKNLKVEKGQRFSIHPADAKVVFVPANGSSVGPFAAVGGDLPGDKDPIVFTGRQSVNTTVDLSDEEKGMLEALGYIQDQ